MMIMGESLASGILNILDYFASYYEACAAQFAIVMRCFCAVN